MPTMSDTPTGLATVFFSELLTADQLVRGQIGRVLPAGMELNQFMVLNHLAQSRKERTPAELARLFHVTKGAMTNTLGKLEAAGHVHIRPDWDDARRKLVGISPAGKMARDAALSAIAPVLEAVADAVGHKRIRDVLPVLRDLRLKMETGD